MSINFLRKNPMAVVLGVGGLAVLAVLLSMVNGGLLKSQVSGPAVAERKCFGAGSSEQSSWNEVMGCIGEQFSDCRDRSAGLVVSDCKGERVVGEDGSVSYEHECSYYCPGGVAVAPTYSINPERERISGWVSDSDGANVFTPGCLVPWDEESCSTREVVSGIVKKDSCFDDRALFEWHTRATGDSFACVPRQYTDITDRWNVSTIECRDFCRRYSGDVSTGGSCKTETVVCGPGRRTEVDAGFCQCAPPPLSSPVPTTTGTGDPASTTMPTSTGEALNEGDNSPACLSDSDCTTGYVCDTLLFECVVDELFVEETGDPIPSDEVLVAEDTEEQSPIETAFEEEQYAEVDATPSDDSFFDFFL